MSRSQEILDILKTAGLAEQEGLIFMTLLESGPQTISEISRNSGVERTKVYRCLSTLEDMGFIEKERKYAHDVISAVSIDSVQNMLIEKEEALLEARKKLPMLAHLSSSVGATGSHVKVFNGKSGVKQLLWNETRAVGEVLSVIVEPIQAKTNAAFFSRWVQKCNQRSMVFRGVVGEEFSKKRDQWYEEHVHDRIDHWSGRVVARDVFHIDQNILIYDDVVAYFTWSDEEQFGVEIHSASVAKTQRQFFELLWQVAE